ncbi:unnamed protein product [Prunus brigantina]
MTSIIIQALEITGQRGVINRGWGGLGNCNLHIFLFSMAEPSDSVYLVDNCPHDWLFQRCSALVHHGGVGTTAAGLKAACPTTIVPFFGDQPFWGERVHARGVGPAPIPADEFSLEKLVDALRFIYQSAPSSNSGEIAVIAIGLVVLLVKIVIVIVICQRRSQKGSSVNPDFQTLTMDKFLNDMEREKPIRFTSQQLRIATDNFTNLLGQGGFGAVYKGIFSDGTLVAVKF